MEKALRILDDAVKSLESEIRVWTKQNQPDVVEKCKLELQQVNEAIRKLSGGECSHESSVLPIHGVRLSLPFNDLYKELDDKRMYQHVNRSAFHLYRKQLAEHLLDNYEIYAKGERQ